MVNKNVVSNSGAFLTNSAGAFVIALATVSEIVRIRLVQTAEYITQKIIDQEWVF